MAATLAEIMAGLNSQYDPQAKLIADQQAALPGQETAAISGLNQAKDNAFTGITNQANDRGVLYSGAPIKEQQVYTGERYLPALAGIKQNTQEQGYKLQSALLGLRQQQGQQAYGIRNDQLNGEQQAAEYAQKRADQIYQFNQKLQESKTAKAAKVDPAKGYVAGKDNGGGLSYRDNKGNPITSAQYYNAKGASGISAIIADLGNSKNKADAKIASEAASGKYTYDQLVAKYPYVFGGV